MVIQIDGVNSQNKGAELMLIAILEEIENRYPGSTVYVNPDSSYHKELLPQYNLKIKRRIGLKIGRYVNSIAYRLKFRQPFSYFKENYSLQKIDIILDSSGFKYSDQWKRAEDWIKSKEQYYKKAKKNGTQIYFLPQAFGPFETKNGKRSVKMLNTYCDLIFAREKTSFNYLLQSGCSTEKVYQSCDFTLKVKGVVPQNLKQYAGYISIIPNKKIITHGNNNSSCYLDFILQMITYFREKGEKVLLLNHEGDGDYKLCALINSKLNQKIDIISGLHAKEVKGLISISKLVISSRFHGVASSLSSGVPCFATSWSHKYEMLFEDFQESNRILYSDNSFTKNLAKFDSIYDEYIDVSNKLKSKKEFLVNQINDMWSIIFEHYEKTKKT